jgi:hypothetical protein
MKITITYGYDPNMTFFCTATAIVNGQAVHGFGKTYEDARIDLLDKLKRENPTPPPPEDIDLDIAQA